MVYETDLVRYASAMRKNLIPSIVVLCFVAGSIGAQQTATTPAASGNDSLQIVSLQVSAPQHDPLRLSAADVKAMPHLSVVFHNTHTNANETYSGVRLANILAKVNAPLGKDLRGKALADYIVATGSDGYKAVLALAEVDPEFHPGEVVVADQMDGKPLDEHSGPLKLVVTEDKRPARAVRNLVEIELKTLQ
jgi:hypothetical protein